MKTTSKKNLFLIPLKFRANLSWDWLSSLRFYDMFVEDNQIIFNLTSQQKVKIPHMTLDNLKDILFKKLKLGKACDVFKLSVEHLRFAGDNILITYCNY